MKKLLLMIGVAGFVCLNPACKKENPAPLAAAAVQQQDTASLYVMLDSKACTVPQKEYTSASVDIRGIAVFSSELGWQELTPVPGAWDVVSLQSAPVPVAEITEVTKVNAGTITKIKLTIGDNNHLVVSDHGIDCYKIGSKEIMIDLNANIVADRLNEIVLSIDICGKFTATPRYQEDPCYTLNPEFAFQSIVQR